MALVGGGVILLLLAGGAAWFWVKPLASRSLVAQKNRLRSLVSRPTTGSRADEPRFEGNWVILSSETGNEALDEMTRKNMSNYHQRYLLGRENGEYFFQPVGGPPSAPKARMVSKRRGKKLGTSDDQDSTVGGLARSTQAAMMLKRQGNKLVAGDDQDSNGRVEYTIVNGQLVVRYYYPYSGAFSHEVRFVRE